VTISEASFDQSNALGTAASCIADQSITINVAGASKTVLLEFSRVCPYVSYLGALNLALAFLSAMFIVFRRS
jgi:hypothetical protein